MVPDPASLPSGLEVQAVSPALVLWPGLLDGLDPSWSVPKPDTQLENLWPLHMVRRKWEAGKH